ncbi:MAG: MMPL family transporter [Thermoleophilia bacterium]
MDGFGDESRSETRLGRLLGLPTGRRSKWLVLVVWLAVVAGLGPLAGKFEGAQKNEPSSFLPGSAESLAVLEASREFPAGESTPAIAVYHRDGGLTDADRERIEADRAALAADPPAGVSEVAPSVLSEDGTGALLTVPIVADGDDEVLIDAVERVREQVGDAGGDGLEVAVSGPAGFSADASKAFEGINSTLLFAAAGLVFVLLVLIYRSPVFWLLPLLAVLFAEATVRAIGYGIASAGVVVNGQTGGILLVLVFGAGTDYALFLTARYREELRRHEDKHEAMRLALRQTTPALLASAGTVIAGLLCLSLAEVNGTAGLGPVAAMGIAVAALTMLTLLPALLLIGGRRAFWPFVPRFEGDQPPARGAWHRLGERVERRPRRIWLGTAVALGAMCVGLVTLDNDLTSANGFRDDVESVRGQELLARSFPAGANAPTVVLVRDAALAERTREAAAASSAVASVGEVEQGAPGARFQVVLREEPFSEAGYAAIQPLREELRAVAGDAVLVGGPTAEERDLRASAQRDTILLVPIVLLVVFLILIALLRAITAPVLLMGTVLLSFFAALGISGVFFDYAFDFPGEDPSLPLYAFIFLVALGVDYNIFLMARVREEALRHGTRDGMLRGLAVTGGVITSAGIVLAGTFGVLAVLPIVALTQIGFVVALGVLLDAIVVRSILVPALVFDLGRRVWWPSRLGRDDGGAPPGPSRASPAREPAQA